MTRTRNSLILNQSAATATTQNSHIRHGMYKTNYSDGNMSNATSITREVVAPEITHSSATMATAMNGQSLKQTYQLNCYNDNILSQNKMTY